MAGAVFREFLEIAGVRNVVFGTQNASPRWDAQGHRSGGCEMTILCSYYPRIILGSWSNRLYIGGSNSGISRSNLELRSSWQAQYLLSLKGDFTCLAQGVNDASYARRINHESQFASQGQYLVKLEADSCCSAHCK